MGKLATVAIVAALMLGGCSTVMEANRPDPVNLAQFSPGMRRVEVVGKLGPAESSVRDGSNNCDVYRLYTRGVGRVGKAGIIVGEAAADVFTLGLAEVVTTSGEAATKNKLHTVMMCYSTSEVLVSVSDDGAVVAPQAVASAK
jgi:hypothetical protein